MKKGRCERGCGRMATKRTKVGERTTFVCGACCRDIVRTKPFSGRVLSICSYGKRDDVQYVSAVVHVGSETIASRVYSLREVPPHKALKDALDFGQHHNIGGVMSADGVFPVEFDSNGSLLVRIVDKPFAHPKAHEWN
jgi:hypothetical protein